MALGQSGEPMYSSGNFGVVFTLSSLAEEQPFSLKCFTRHQWGRREAYQRLCCDMPSSPFLAKMEYLSDEIAVCPYGSDSMQLFDALRMEYIEGVTLSEMLRQCVYVHDIRTLQQLSRAFEELALWLLGEPVAHGDIKPDNIMVTPNMELKLIDYDGFYLPGMVGESQRECGTESFQHPLRSSAPFDRNIDDYSIAALCLSLRVAAKDIEVYERFCTDSSELIFSPSEAIAYSSVSLDYISQCEVVDERLITAVRSASPHIPQLAEIIASTSNESRVLAQELSALRVNGKWGYVSASGEMVVEARFDEAREFSMGLAAVCIDGQWGYVSKTGAWKVAAQYERAWDFDELTGLALICVGGKYGYVNSSAQMVIAPQFDYALSFSERYAVAVQGRKFGYIDTVGDWVVRPIYDNARSVRGGRGEVQLEGRVKVIVF